MEQLTGNSYRGDRRSRSRCQQTVLGSSLHLQWQILGTAPANPFYRVRQGW